MKRILLVDLGERELKKRQELRARQQVLETKDKTADTSGGLNSKELDELTTIRRQLASDVVVDPFYRLVAATHQQKDWKELRRDNAFVHEYGLLGSQRMLGNLLDPLEKNEREIASICGLLQIDGYTDASRPDFVQRISNAQGEYRRYRDLFDAVYAHLSQRYEVSLKSQVDAGLVDAAIVGCVDPGGDPQSRAELLDHVAGKRTAVTAAQGAATRAAEAERAAQAAKESAQALARTLKDKEAALEAVRKATPRDQKAIRAATRAVGVAAKAAETAEAQAKSAATLAREAKEVAKEARAEASDASVAAGIRATQAAFSPSMSETICALSSRNVAAVVRRLATEKVSSNDAWLASRIQNAYDMDTGVVAGAPPSSMEIMLPDLDEGTDVEIIRENLHAVQAIYFSWMLEEMHLPQVVERIVELFRSGLLPLGRGKAGDYLFNYYKRSVDRITEGERRDLYMRVFGAPGGDPNGNQPNREFNELWLRFVSAVSSFARQLTVNNLLRSNIPVAVSQEQVRKAGRDLGANLSLHGYGIAYFAATELQAMIREYLEKLGDPEIRQAFGARDIWQVVDQVNANYLGGPRNSHRYRTQAHAGAVIIRWLANHRQRLGGRFGEVISLAALTNPQLRGSDQPTIEPNDWDLVQACEQWLAVGGVQDDNIERYAQPVESPVITSKPIEMPAFARDALDSLTGGIGGSLNGALPPL
ncbi:hypothetical protein [Marilutibacter alkalisoli]|uniref:Uncharacterized protein n=1 Tax=Marilutibacter alkalisoli TaxID=2591633 RepID=A0A514BTV3_9GAMM|nr:hypothetical protein [Lysobacter alkalisoli]QDH70459.1 hypothetical protein FKV23_10480 [Lysobacter alkalisoli]